MLILECYSRDYSHVIAIEKLDKINSGFIGYKYFIINSSNDKDRVLKARTRFQAYKEFIKLRKELELKKGVCFAKIQWR